MHDIRAEKIVYLRSQRVQSIFGWAHPDYLAIQKKARENYALHQHLRTR